MKARCIRGVPTIPRCMPAISFQNVGKTYSGARGAVHALHDVSFDIQPGEFFGLLGAWSNYPVVVAERK